MIEVMGGIEPAKSICSQIALHAGKHVVTVNKDLIAVYGRELLDAAEEQHCDLLFEAAVAGAIPIIRPLKQCLAANEISEVLGIVNGTTNYILTRMFEDHMDFETALAKATELGYAEADPTADVEGLDAGRKWRSCPRSHFIHESFLTMCIQRESLRSHPKTLNMQGNLTV